MAMVELTRWCLEQVDKTNGKNTAKYYNIYVFPTRDGDVAEVRHWGRIGTQGRSEVFKHETLNAAFDSASRKMYAERSKGYALVDERTFVPSEPIHHGTHPIVLDRLARADQNRMKELGLGDSPLDQFAREVQNLLVQLQDPKTPVDMERIHNMKMRWEQTSAEFDRAAAAMKMIDLVAWQRVSALTQKDLTFRSASA